MDQVACRRHLGSPASAGVSCPVARRSPTFPIQLSRVVERGTTAMLPAVQGNQNAKRERGNQSFCRSSFSNGLEIPPILIGGGGGGIGWFDNSSGSYSVFDGVPINTSQSVIYVIVPEPSTLALFSASARRACSSSFGDDGGKLRSTVHRAADVRQDGAATIGWCARRVDRPPGLGWPNRPVTPCWRKE